MFGADAAVTAFWEDQGTGEEPQDHLDYLFPRFSHQDPWNRHVEGTNNVLEDFILIAEFSEQEGPRPVIVIPKDGGGKFDKNEFSVKILAVDHQSSIAESGQLSEDTQVIMEDNEKHIHAFVHHLVLNDIQARGYVRPFCITYVTSDSRKLMTCYEELSSQMKKVARYMKYGNRLVFMRDLEKYLEDLSYTKAHLLISQSRTSEQGTARGVSADNELLNVLNTIRQSMEEVTSTLSDTRQLLDDRELEERFQCLERHLKSGCKPGNQGSDSNSLQDFSMDKSHVEEGTSGSFNDCASPEFSLFNKSKDQKPKLLDVHAIRGKRRFDRSLRGLHELCSWGAKEGLQRLRLVREFFRRDLSCILVDELDTSVMNPSYGVLSFGPDLIGANFLSSHTRTSDFHRGHFSCKDGSQSFPSLGSQDSFKSLPSSLQSSFDDDDPMMSAHSSLLESFSTLDKYSSLMDFDTPGSDYFNDRRFSSSSQASASEKVSTGDESDSFYRKPKHSDGLGKDPSEKSDCSSVESGSNSVFTTTTNCYEFSGKSRQEPMGERNQEGVTSQNSRHATVSTTTLTEYDEYINIEIEVANNSPDDTLCETVHVCDNQNTPEDGVQPMAKPMTSPFVEDVDDDKVVNQDVKAKYISDSLGGDQKKQTVVSDMTGAIFNISNKDSIHVRPSTLEGILHDQVTVETQDPETTVKPVNSNPHSQCDGEADGNITGDISELELTLGKDTCDTYLNTTIQSSCHKPVHTSDYSSSNIPGVDVQDEATVTEKPVLDENNLRLLHETGEEKISNGTQSRPQSDQYKSCTCTCGTAVPGQNHQACTCTGISDICMYASSRPGRAHNAGCSRAFQSPPSLDHKHKLHKRRLKMKCLFKESSDSDYGLQKLLRSLNHLQHVVFSLLSGRPVIVIGTKRQDSQIREIINALRVFLPVLSSEHVLLVCQLRQLKLVDIHKFRLAGIIRSDKKSLDYIVPHSIRRYLTLFDVERMTIQCQPYQGTLLNFISAIFNKKRVFKSEQTLHMFIQLLLMEISSKAFNFYHCIFMADKESLSGTSMLRKSSMQELSAERFLNKYGLHNSDCRIIKYLAEIIKVQQIEQEFKSKSLTDCPVYPFTVSYQALQTFRC